MFTNPEKQFLSKSPAALMVALLATSLSSHASTWSGADGNWNSNSSKGWNGTGVPNAVGAIASFTSTTAARTTTQNISAGVTIGTLSFTGSAVGSWIVKLTKPLTFNQDAASAGTALIENTNTSTSASNFFQIGSATKDTITLADNLRITNAAGAGANGSVYILAAIGGNGDVTFSNANTGIDQAGSIHLGSATNTFDGAVLVEKGTVAFSDSKSLGNTTNVVTLGQSGQGSAALLATSSNSTIQNSIIVAAGSGGTLTLGKINTGATTYSGGITLNGDLSIYSEVSNVAGLDFTGVISGTGSITQDPGTSKATGIVVFSAANTFSGATNLGSPAVGSGSKLVLANSLALQNSTLSYTGTSKLEFASTVTSQAFTFGGLTGTSEIALQDNAATPLAIALSVGNNNSDTTYSGALSGAGSLTKIGTGSLTLTGANSYTGATTIDSGKLVLNGSTSSASAVSVSAGSVTGISVATLAGSGIVGGNLSLAAESTAGFKNGGTLAPTAGASGTNLSVTGTTTFNTGSIFEWDLNAATSDTGATNQGAYGQLAGTGTIGLASGSTGAVFKIVLGSNAFTDAFWDTNKTWNNVFSGAGATTDLASIFNSFGGDAINSAGMVAGQGQFAFSGPNSITWSAVPEPTTALAGLLLAAGLLRRQRN